MLALMLQPTFWQVRIISEEVFSFSRLQTTRSMWRPRHSWNEAQVSDQMALQISLSIIHVTWNKKLHFSGNLQTSRTACPGEAETSEHDDIGCSPENYLASMHCNDGPSHSWLCLLKFQPVCALGPLAYFRWVIDDKLSLDILPPARVVLAPSQYFAS